MGNGAIPPLPSGYTLVSAAPAIPPLPAGYALDNPSAASPLPGILPSAQEQAAAQLKAIPMNTSAAPARVRTLVQGTADILGGLAAGAVASPTVAGTAAGAALGVAGGDQLGQIINEKIFDEGNRNLSAEGLEQTALKSAVAAGGAGIMAKLAGVPWTTPKPAPAMQVLGPQEQWADANNALGVKALKVGRYGGVPSNPGRGITNAGLDPVVLRQMTPEERLTVLGPHWRDAGAAVDDAVTAATDHGVTVDVGNTATKTLGKIADPVLGQKATDIFNNLAHNELGIEDLRDATPEQARMLRTALKGGARFGPSGDLSSLSGVRAELYRSVNQDLHEGVPGLQPIDQHYADMSGAMDSVQKQVGKFRASLPESSLPQQPATADLKSSVAQQLIRSAVTRAVGRALPWVGGAAVEEALRRMGVGR